MGIPITEFLTLMARMSIALVGFSAIVIAFQNSKNEAASILQHYISKMLVGLGGIILLFSLLPLAISAYGIELSFSLQICGAILAVVSMGIAISILVTSQKIFIKARGRKFGPLEYLRIFVVTLFCLLLLVSSFKPDWIPIVPTYQAVLTLLMVWSTLMIFMFVKWYGRKEGDEN